ncbi:hypothetical protein ACFP3U_33375 [Kitasatospora misakiensis]|uniref:Uncharacterized protein n=1 Tax=Kitasatospora misakiensis TaxID=67330 RepID=A0ABW0XBE8_9ACTN
MDEAEGLVVALSPSNRVSFKLVTVACQIVEEKVGNHLLDH